MQQCNFTEVISTCIQLCNPPEILSVLRKRTNLNRGIEYSYVKKRRNKETISVCVKKSSCYLAFNYLYQSLKISYGAESFLDVESLARL